MKKFSLKNSINTKLGIDLLIAYFGVQEIPNLLSKVINITGMSKIVLNIIGLVGLYFLQDVLKRKDTLTLGVFLVLIDLISGSISGLLPSSMQDYQQFEARQLSEYTDNVGVTSKQDYEQIYN